MYPLKSPTTQKCVFLIVTSRECVQNDEQYVQLEARKLHIHLLDVKVSLCLNLQFNLCNIYNIQVTLTILVT